MIESLHIENVAVVKCLDVDFHGGMTVLSGETGAGKSIIIDSLNLLLGGRADRELIRTGEEKCLVSALFGDLSERTLSLLSELGFEAEESLMLSRTVTKSGSSARLNGRAIPLSVLREISGTLFNIHGQNDNQQLLDPSGHVDLLDAYGGSGELRSEYAELYRQVLHLRAQIDSLRRDARERTRLGESLRYQLAEIDKIKPKRGEEEALSELTKRLRSLERIQQCVALVEKALQGGEKGRGAIYLSERAASAMESLGDAIPEAERLAARLQDVRVWLSEFLLFKSDRSDLKGGKLKCYLAVGDLKIGNMSAVKLHETCSDSESGKSHSANRRGIAIVENSRRGCAVGKKLRCGVDHVLTLYREVGGVELSLSARDCGGEETCSEEVLLTLKL